MLSPLTNLDLTAQAVVYRGEATLLYAPPAGTARPLAESLMHAFTEDLKFGLVDRYLTDVIHLTRGRAVLSSGGLALEVDRKSEVRGLALGLLPAQWLAVVRQKRQCVFLFITEPVSGDLRSVVRHATGQRKCFGFRVPVEEFTYTSTEAGRYRFIGRAGATSSLAPSSTLVIMDSNVLLDLEIAAKNPERVDAARTFELSSLAHQLMYQDVIAGLAIRELAYAGPAGGLNEERRTSLSAAMDAWFDFGPDGVTDLNVVHSNWASTKGSPASTHDVDIRHLSLPVYTSLLKISVLADQIQGFKARQRVALFRKYCEWVDNELGFVSAYTQQIAQDLFLSEPKHSKYTRQLLKLGPRRLRELRGATWDVMMLNFLNMTIFGWIENPYNLTPHIVTADKGMAGLAQRMKLSAGLASGPNELASVGIFESELCLDKRLQPLRRDIESASQILGDGIVRRGGVLPHRGIIEQWERLAHKLEVEAEASART